MLPPFPIKNVTRYPYRFLDTYGLPDMPGDVSRFTAAHVRVDAGPALPGVWRPVDATADATVSIDRGCLVVECATGASTAAHMSVSEEVDAIFEVIPDHPFRDTNMVVTCGVYIESVLGTGLLAAVNTQSDTKLTVTEGVSSRNVPVVSVRKGSVDLTDAALPATLTTYGGIEADMIGHQAAYFFRAKCSTSSGLCCTYYSLNGLSWKRIHSTSGAITLTSIGVFVSAEGDFNPAGRVRIAGVKFLNPNTPFPS